ncbi:MAG: hypothetical protein K8R45_01305, partial [Desulfobacterales bacterium]|nr:hypothetical protein [Desulfobacterales bacterium]
GKTARKQKEPQAQKKKSTPSKTFFNLIPGCFVHNLPVFLTLPLHKQHGLVLLKSITHQGFRSFSQAF